MFDSIVTPHLISMSAMPVAIDRVLSEYSEKRTDLNVFLKQQPT